MPDLDDDVNMDKLLDSIESLENLGIDVSFVPEVRKIYGSKAVSKTSQVCISKKRIEPLGEMNFSLKFSLV